MSTGSKQGRSGGGAPLRQLLAAVRLILCYALACFIALFAGLQTQSLQETDWGLNSPLPPDAQVPFLGITVALEQYTPAELPVVLARLRDSGFGWVRQRLDWNQLEPQPGEYAWQTSDTLIDALAAAGLVPVLVLDGSPPWARSTKDTGAADNPLAPPSDPAAYARFAGAVAGRYHDQVRFYQIWDEPNIAPHWGARHIEPVNYALLLKAAAQAIRAADPDAIILTGALAPTTDRGHTAIDENYFLERLYAAGAAPYFDAVAVQAFGFGAAPADPRARPDRLNFQRVKLVRRTMLAAGDGATPIWATRYGWNRQTNSLWRTVTPEMQAAFAVEALDIAYRRWPWLTAMAWMIDQPIEPVDDPAWGFALTPELAAAIKAWQTEKPGVRPSTPASTHLSPQKVLPYFIYTLLLWRAIAAGSLLPWRSWLARYRHWPPVGWFAAWTALAIAYSLATWPPLILLCWICAAFLMLAHPLIGLGTAAFLLPFYYYHKEFNLTSGVWTVPPAFAVILCLLPALVARIIGWGKQTRFQSTLTEAVAALVGSRDRVYARRQARLGPQTAAALRHLYTSLHDDTRRLGLSSFDALALAFFAISLLSRANVWRRVSYQTGLIELVVYPLLFYVAVRLFAGAVTSARTVALCAFAGGVFVALFGLRDWLAGAGAQADGVLRLMGPYYSPNHTALYLIRSLFLGFGLVAASAVVWTRILGLAASVVIIPALALTVSRGAWLLGIPAGIAICVLWWRLDDKVTRIAPPRHLVTSSPFGRHTMKIITAAAVVVLGAVFLFLSPRLANGATIASRWFIWRNTWQLWLDYWLVGVGPGGFFWHYPAYLTQFTDEPNILHPHSVWLEVAATWGMLGCLWFFALFSSVIRTMRRIHRPIRTSRGESLTRPYWLAAGAVAGLAAAFAHAQVDTFLLLPDLAAWNWLALGLLASTKKGLTAPGPLENKHKRKA